MLTKRVKVIIIPDIESVNYGRGVGYDIIEHVPPSEIGKISATKIRKNYLVSNLCTSFKSQTICTSFSNNDSCEYALAKSC